MKHCSFEVAKAIKEAGYPQDKHNNSALYPTKGEFKGVLCSYNDTAPERDKDSIIAPEYLEIWLWLWREKNIRFDVENLWDANFSYPQRGCVCNTNQLGSICTPEVSDPEEAIIAAIEYLVTNNLIK